MSVKKPDVKIIGGGLSGAECALKLLDEGFSVEMVEMRPERTTGAHTGAKLAELVCSNSLKSVLPETASGLLKEELDIIGCRLLDIARKCSVPSGGALAVDREEFSIAVESALNSYDGFRLVRKEAKSVDGEFPTVIATGPLTSPEFSEYLCTLTGKDRLFFYDAIAPVVGFDSVDMSYAYFGGRYGKGGEDYLNLPMQREEYELFYNELVHAQSVVLRDFEKRELFDGCMPIEEIAKRGSDTMRFGPLRPIGLSNPQTGEKAYAVVQLRKENVAGDCYNMVGFQTNLTFGEQKRVFSLIPALHDAEFLRYGTMHRNTYISSPGLLSEQFRLRGENCFYIAGQLSGVEGYVESIASGLIAAISLSRELKGLPPVTPPPETIIGALCRYVSACPGDFKPMNANFGLLPPIADAKKKDRKRDYHDRSIGAMIKFKETL